MLARLGVVDVPDEQHPVKALVLAGALYFTRGYVNGYSQSFSDTNSSYYVLLCRISVSVIALWLLIKASQTRR